MSKYVMVPSEPTEAMLHEGAVAKMSGTTVGFIYTRMIEAAPSPAPVGGDLSALVQSWRVRANDAKAEKRLSGNEYGEAEQRGLESAFSACADELAARLAPSAAPKCGRCGGTGEIAWQEAIGESERTIRVVDACPACQPATPTAGKPEAGELALSGLAAQWEAWEGRCRQIVAEDDPLAQAIACQADTIAICVRELRARLKPAALHPAPASGGNYLAVYERERKWLAGQLHLEHAHFNMIAARLATNAWPAPASGGEAVAWQLKHCDESQPRPAQMAKPEQFYFDHPNWTVRPLIYGDTPAPVAPTVGLSGDAGSLSLADLPPVPEPSFRVNGEGVYRDTKLLAFACVAIRDDRARRLGLTADEVEALEEVVACIDRGEWVYPDDSLAVLDPLFRRLAAAQGLKSSVRRPEQSLPPAGTYAGANPQPKDRDHG